MKLCDGSMKEKSINYERRYLVTTVIEKSIF